MNSWQESETAIALAETLDEDAVIVEGYAEYATWRPHLAYLRDPYGDPDVEMELDGIGGVSILAKARVSRAGVHFPAFSFERHAETEGFGKMAKRMDFSVVGLPHYTVWHLYEPSVDDIRHMEEMENEKREREAKEKEAADLARKVQENFQPVGKEWEKEKEAIAESASKKSQKHKFTGEDPDDENDQTTNNKATGRHSAIEDDDEDTTEKASQKNQRKGGRSSGGQSVDDVKRAAFDN